MLSAQASSQCLSTLKCYSAGSADHRLQILLWKTPLHATLPQIALSATCCPVILNKLQKEHQTASRLAIRLLHHAAFDFRPGMRMDLGSSSARTATCGCKSCEASVPSTNTWFPPSCGLEAQFVLMSSFSALHVALTRSHRASTVRLARAVLPFASPLQPLHPPAHSSIITLFQPTTLTPS